MATWECWVVLRPAAGGAGELSHQQWAALVALVDGLRGQATQAELVCADGSSLMWLAGDGGAALLPWFKAVGAVAPGSYGALDEPARRWLMTRGSVSPEPAAAPR
jgi:hypothetical protein